LSIYRTSAPRPFPYYGIRYQHVHPVRLSQTRSDPSSYDGKGHQYQPGIWPLEQATTCRQGSSNTAEENSGDQRLQLTGRSLAPMIPSSAGFGSASLWGKLAILFSSTT